MSDEHNTNLAQVAKPAGGDTPKAEISYDGKDVKVSLVGGLAILAGVAVLFCLALLYWHNSGTKDHKSDAAKGDVGIAVVNGGIGVSAVGVDKSGQAKGGEK
ncbi:hypothetical protein RN01_07435 [Cupriavidus sp. SHE]|mgnify:CR=1 FL=1|jgi:hypothetical protein|uniref:Uncharacterized protein n=1 Tax=Cupriavidus metallidurans TaxID=119219 RepID=A0A482IP07_9BURK|nr:MULTISPECIES: hypothetical protein [Cupriavidus]KWR84328.1 hypothetical protein RN01_07435 [Cupriavidus sp. SHE]QBP09921.1 hypothetical protein DDF84_009165 [Cupriavidus metallidurans]